MQKKKIFVAMNALTNIDALCASSIQAEFYKIAQSGKYETTQWNGQRLSIDNFRNQAARFALEMECDYLVFIDDDMILTPGTVEALIESNYDIIMAHTFIRGLPFEPMSFTGNEHGLNHFRDVIEKADPETGIADCCAVGFACCAIKVDKLREIEPPYFVTGPGVCTEDIYFCLKAHKKFPDLKVGVHTKVPTAHLVQPVFVSQETVEDLRELFGKWKDRAFNSLESTKRGDRGSNYHDTIVKA